MNMLDDLLGETMETAARMLGGKLVYEKWLSDEFESRGDWEDCVIGGDGAFEHEHEIGFEEDFTEEDASGGNHLVKVKVYDVVSGDKRYLVWLYCHVYSEGHEDVVCRSEYKEIALDAELDVDEMDID